MVYFNTTVYGGNEFYGKSTMQSLVYFHFFVALIMTLLK